MPSPVEDAEILSKFQDESTRNEAFNLLLNKYQQKIYWHVRRMVMTWYRMYLLRFGKTCPVLGAMHSYIPGCTALPPTSALPF
jgi:hypothetical protein